MSKPFKPSGSTSVAAYLVARGAQRVIDFLKTAFDGKIMHSEVRAGVGERPQIAARAVAVRV